MTNAPANTLTARDALSETVIRTKGSSYGGDLLRHGNDGIVCVVFDNDETDDKASFLGLVSADVARLQPTMIFSELAAFLPVQSVTADTSLSQVKKLMVSGKADALPVFDNDSFLGVVTTHSVMAALLQREEELGEKLRSSRKHAQEEKRRREEWVKRLEQLNRAFRKLTSLLARPPGPDVFQRGTEALAIVMQAQYGAVSILDSAGRYKESIFTGVTPGSTGDVTRFMEQRKVLLDIVSEKKSSLRISDVPHYMRKHGTPCRHPTARNFLGVPIAREDDVFGVVYFCDREGGAFSEDDEALVASFAQGLSLVFSQLKEREQRKRAERDRTVLNHLVAQLSGADTLDKVAEIVRRNSLELWEWDAIMLSIRRGGIERFTSVLLQDNAVPDGPPIAPREQVLCRDDVSPEVLELEKLLLAGNAALVNRKTGDEGLALTRFGSDQPSASLLFAPVRVENEVLGILSVQSYKPDFFDERDKELLLQVADAAGPALARCHAEKRTTAFANLGLKLNSTKSPEEAAEIISETADELLSWDSCSVDLYDELSRTGKSVLHVDIINGERVKIIGDAIPKMGTPTRKAIHEGPQLILRQKGEQPSDAVPFGDLNRLSSSLMFVPLRIAGTVTGILSIQSYTHNAYNERDLQLLQALGDHCSGALERTRLQKELSRSATSPAQ